MSVKAIKYFVCCPLLVNNKTQLKLTEFNEIWIPGMNLIIHMSGGGSVLKRYSPRTLSNFITIQNLNKTVPIDKMVSNLNEYTSFNLSLVSRYLDKSKYEVINFPESIAAKLLANNSFAKLTNEEREEIKELLQ